MIDAPMHVTGGATSSRAKENNSDAVNAISLAPCKTSGLNSATISRATNTQTAAGTRPSNAWPALACHATTNVAMPPATTAPM